MIVWLWNLSKAFFFSCACLVYFTSVLFTCAAPERIPPQVQKHSAGLNAPIPNFLQRPSSQKQMSATVWAKCSSYVCRHQCQKNVLKRSPYSLVGWPGRLAALFKGLRGDLERVEIHFDCQDNVFLWCNISRLNIQYIIPHATRQIPKHRQGWRVTCKGWAGACNKVPDLSERGDYIWTWLGVRLGRLLDMFPSPWYCACVCVLVCQWSNISTVE